MKAALDGKFRTFNTNNNPDTPQGYRTIEVPKHWWPGCEKTLRDLYNDEQKIEKAKRRELHEILEQRKRERAAMKIGIAKPKFVTMEDALEAVINAWGVTLQAFLGPQRGNRVVGARSHFAWLIRLQRPDLSLAAIGRFMNRDHSTVLTASGRFATRPSTMMVEIVNKALEIET